MVKELRSDGVNQEQQEQPIVDLEELRRPGNPQDAERYDVGMAADPEAEVRALYTVEPDPRGDDILPDHIERFADAPSEDDIELTARPREPIHPFPPDELPEG